MTVVKIFFVIVILPFSVLSQTVTTKKESSRIDGQNSDGYQVELSASADEVKPSLVKYLKTFARTRNSGEYITVVNPVINGKTFTGTLYATTKQPGNIVAVWMGFRSGGEEEPDLDSNLRTLVHNFGVTFYREKIQQQIDESVRALQAVEKQQMRLVNQNKDLNNKIENNKREKIELEKSLAENGIELETLTQKLAANGKAQDSVAVAAEQIKKMMEAHKERQRKVN